MIKTGGEHLDKYLKNLKIGTKLKKVFVGVLLQFMIVLIVSLVAISLTRLNMRRFHDVSYQSNVLQLMIQKDYQVVNEMVLKSITTYDMEKKKDYLDKVDKYSKSFEKNVESLQKIYPDSKNILELKDVMAKTKKLRKELSDYALDNNNSVALEYFNTTYNGTNEEMQNILMKIKDYSQEDADSKYKSTESIATISGLVVIALGILCILFIMKVKAVLTKLINQPIKEIEAATEKMKAGNLDIQISYESEDELGVLVMNFKETCDALNEIVVETGLLLSEMAKGDFDVHTTKEDKFVGQFSDIIQSMNQMNIQLDDTLKQIRCASDQVTAGASQLARNAQELAKGATEQAEAVEGLTATVEGVASISRESAKSAESAYQKVVETANNAERSQEELHELTSAMDRISNTSKEIRNIISSIEDIAEQTNLLSLNASIEAARAGEAGRGFSVVADQIGKLAADSAQSASNTRELIEKALLEIENGNIVTAKTVEALNSILSGINIFAEVVRGTSESSNTQADMLNQIQKGIEQISEVVQSNSAAAQETSATSEELSAQSENLNNLVGRFKLRK